MTDEKMRLREANGVCKRKKDSKSYHLLKGGLYILKFGFSDSSTGLVWVPMAREQGEREGYRPLPSAHHTVYLVC